MTPSLPRSGGQPARFIALGCRLLAFLVIVYQGMRFALDVVGLIRVPSRSQSNPILDGKYYDYVPVASAPLEEVLGFRFLYLLVWLVPALLLFFFSNWIGRAIEGKRPERVHPIS